MELEKIRKNHYRFTHNGVKFLFAATRRDKDDIHPYPELIYYTTWRFDKYGANHFVAKEFIKDKKALNMYLEGMASGFIKQYKLGKKI